MFLAWFAIDSKFSGTKVASPVMSTLIRPEWARMILRITGPNIASTPSRESLHGRFRLLTRPPQDEKSIHDGPPSTRAAARRAPCEHSLRRSVPETQVVNRLSRCSRRGRTTSDRSRGGRLQRPLVPPILESLPLLV